MSAAVFWRAGVARGAVLLRDGLDEGGRRFDPDGFAWRRGGLLGERFHFCGAGPPLQDAGIRAAGVADVASAVFGRFLPPVTGTAVSHFSVTRFLGLGRRYRRRRCFGVSGSVFSTAAAAAVPVLPAPPSDGSSSSSSSSFSSGTPGVLGGMAVRLRRERCLPLRRFDLHSSQAMSASPEIWIAMSYSFSRWMISERF